MPIKKVINLLLFFFVMMLANKSLSAQVHAGLSFHYSQNTRLGLYADFYDRVVLEGRIIDFSLLIDTPFELYGFYKIINKKDYEIYAGLGYGFSAIDIFNGVIVAVGTNIYPFENKKLGFHIELNPVKGDFSPLIIKASWGMRYTFDWTGVEEEEVEY